MIVARCNQWDSENFREAMHYLALREMQTREILNLRSDKKWSLQIEDVLGDVYHDWLCEAWPAGQG